MSYATLCIAVLLAVALIAHSSLADSAGWRQWQVTELAFIAKSPCANPLLDVQLSAVFSGPQGVRYKVPGFWDGRNAWKIRFTPSVPGQWSYVTSCSDADDTGLHGRRGSVRAVPAESDNQLYQHGGFLKVSDNRRYLTFTDGTPFFWLGDTWWFCPSTLVPFEGSSNPKYPSMYKALVDTRKRQGVTTVGMTFLGPKSTGLSVTKPREWDTSNIAYWSEVDSYVAYANNAGIVPVVGMTFSTGMDKTSLTDFKRLWRYVIARYGSHAVTWLICGEYNLRNVPERVKKVLALGRFIKKTDPYKRAMTVHPWWYVGEKRQAWDQSWYDFIMIQGGHEGPPPVSTYRDAYQYEPTRPVLEAECCYEGVLANTLEDVRLAAYRAIQSGSFGYTYGAHGLWYPTQDTNDTRMDNWGTPMPWWKSLGKPGGRQMRHLRACYESVEWWKLEPQPRAVSAKKRLAEKQRVLTKAEADRVFLIYFPKGLDPEAELTLRKGNPAAAYRARWFNPRTGRAKTLRGKLTMPGGKYLLPDRPDGEDWVLIIQQAQDAP